MVKRQVKHICIICKAGWPAHGRFHLYHALLFYLCYTVAVQFI